MNKQILVISTGPRKGGNSDILADEFMRGAVDAGNRTEKVTLLGKDIHFCKGCLACQSARDGHCIMRDDADHIVQKMAAAQVIVFATPIYFYEMCGQMKTLLDRTNPLFPVDYAFGDIYLLASAADAEQQAIDGAVNGLNGWIACFEKARLRGVVRGVGAESVGAIRNFPDLLNEAYQMGKNA